MDAWLLLVPNLNSRRAMYGFCCFARDSSLTSLLVLVQSITDFRRGRGSCIHVSGR